MIEVRLYKWGAASKVVVIGGGYIGLEVAASLATYGTAATLPPFSPQPEPCLVTETTQHIPHQGAHVKPQSGGVLRPLPPA